MATTAVAAKRLAEIIDKNRAEIERRWLEQVQRVLVKTPEVAITQLRDGIPDYLQALVKLLSSGGEHEIGTTATSAWQDVAREHGITRVRIGFDISELVREFVILRHVIDTVVEEKQETEHGPAALLADSLDAAIMAAVQAYVDARDHQARRTQAQNIAFLTHELRNPLSTAVLALAQLHRHAHPEQRALLDTLERSTKKLSELIDSVLLTQTLEVGKVEVRPTEVTLSQILEPALEASRQMASQKHLSFHASYDPNSTVKLDQLLTRSAISNLADNAAKYTDSGGVEITVEERSERLIVHFRDTCAGISADELQTIFEPFERGHTGKAGTGLGLAIARRAVEAQGGSIHAESSGKDGCHFWVDLPRVAQPATPGQDGE